MVKMMSWDSVKLNEDFSNYYRKCETDFSCINWQTEEPTTCIGLNFMVEKNSVNLHWNFSHEHSHIGHCWCSYWMKYDNFFKCINDLCLQFFFCHFTLMINNLFSENFYFAVKSIWLGKSKCLFYRLNWRNCKFITLDRNSNCRVSLSFILVFSFLHPKAELQHWT